MCNSGMFHVEHFIEENLENFNCQCFIDKMRRYFTVYSDWNSKINLSTIKTEDAFWLKHVLDSVILGYYINKDLGIGKIDNIVDLGTGGGFPGIVLLMLLNKNTFFIDKRSKKLKFIDFAINELCIDNVIARTKHLNFLEHNVSKALEIKGKNTVYVSRAVDILSLFELVKKQKIQYMYVMTTKKALDKVQLRSKNVEIGFVKYSEMFRSEKINLVISDHFSDYIILKMFHVKHF